MKQLLETRSNGRTNVVSHKLTNSQSVAHEINSDVCLPPPYGRSCFIRFAFLLKTAEKKIMKKWNRNKWPHGVRSGLYRLERRGHFFLSRSSVYSFVPTDADAACSGHSTHTEKPEQFVTTTTTMAHFNFESIHPCNKLSDLGLKLPRTTTTFKK